MKKESTYVAKKPDEHGVVHYSDEENAVWHDLITRQIHTVAGRACKEYLRGIDILNLPHDRIPQCHEVSEALGAITGWSVQRVSALISFDKFFDLLANRKFPAATFIRRRDELDYLQEPDMFHEIFGHCPMLTDRVYADFMQAYGELGLKASDKDRVMLARLYWFTVEFGLIKTSEGLRCYGGGILSSHKETIYALESDIPQRQLLTPLEALRTPYRIDIVQPIYFVIEDFQALYDLLQNDLIKTVHKALELGEFEPTFPRETITVGDREE